MWNYVPGKKVTLYIDSADRWHGRPLYSAIVERCHARGISGATVIQCAEGYGSHHVVHTARLLSLSDNLPVRVEIIETVERFPHLLEVLDEFLDAGLCIADDVHILKRAAGGAPAP